MRAEILRAFVKPNGTVDGEACCVLTVGLILSAATLLAVYWAAELGGLL